MSNPENAAVRNLALVIQGWQANVDECLESERRVPEDADMTRREMTLPAIEHLAGAVDMLRALPPELQVAVLARLKVDDATTLIPDLSKFDPWGGAA